MDVLKSCEVVALFPISGEPREKPKVIHNPSKGLWEGNPSKKVTITHLLTLGVEKSDPDQEFYEPRAV